MSILETLSRVPEDDEYTITIVCNQASHAIPADIIRGTKFVFSVGSIEDAGSIVFESELTKLLKKLARKLKQRNWRQIYIVPSGHPSFYANIKLLVFRITRIETVDVVYKGNGRYMDITIDHRRIASE